MIAAVRAALTGVPYTPVNYRAVRAFNRVWGPLGEAHQRAEEADAGFDAGEWSGPSHSLAAQEHEEEVARRVGAQFGMTGEQLLRDVFYDIGRRDERAMTSDQLARHFGAYDY